MRITISESCAVVRDARLGPGQMVIATGQGRVWEVSRTFSGRGIHVKNAAESTGNVMHVFPCGRDSVQLAQYSTLEIEPFEERIQELEHAIRTTIKENKHLADGDDCTLKLLKDAIGAE